MIEILERLGWAKRTLGQTRDREGRAIYVLHPGLGPWKKAIARTILRTFG